MVATENIVMRKLKIKTASKQTETESTTRTCNFGQQVFRNDGCDQIFLSENKKSGMNKLQNLVPRSSVDTNLCSADYLKVKLTEPGCHKRRPAGLVDNQKVKRQKMERGVSLQCSSILKKLMTHPSSWPFNQPVDPEKLNIPDYFSIISEPMDLGTIKTKLEKNLYSSVEEFASDVKLTFSNAMLYNPPDNYVHIMAKELDNFFNSGWKCMDAKWNCKSTKGEQASISSGRPKNIDVSGQNCHKTSSLCISLQPSRLMSAMKKQKLREELVRVLKGNMPRQLQVFLKKYGLIRQKEEKIEVEIDAFDDKTLWELESVIRSSLDTRPAKAEPAKMAEKGRHQSSGKIVHKGTDSATRSASGSGNIKPSLAVSKCGSCGCVRCQCRLQNDFARSSSSDLSSEKSLEQYHHDAFRTAEPAKMAEKGRHQSSGKIVNKGTDSGTRSASGSGNIKPSLAVSKCGSCSSVRCQCRLQNDFARSSSSDLSSEKSLEQEHHDACGTDCEVKNTSSQMSKSDPDSDGAVSALDEEKICSSPQLSTLAATAASGEAWTPLIDVQLSPKKALRAAMLKSRFADTILKAQQKTLLDHGDKADVLKMQQEKERLERMQLEEVARIEAEIKAAEAASRIRAEAELKMQREREREAARLALEKMEKTVEIDENLKILKDLEMLSGCSLFGHFRDGEDGSEVLSESNEGGIFCNALEQLGLFRKDDYMEDENEETILNGDGEEGEIFL